MKNQFWFLLVLVTLLGFPLLAQTSEHQRVGVERKAHIILSPSFSLTVFDSSNEENTAITMIETAAIELTINNTWIVSASIPFNEIINMKMTEALKIPAAFGDPCFGLGRNFRFGDWKSSVDASWSIPLGIWNAHEAAEKHIQTGTGYHQFSSSFSGTRFIDPVALTIGGEVITTAPRKERFGYSREPLELSLPASLTYAANSKLAFSAALTPSLTWPTELEGKPVSTAIEKSLYGNISVTLSGEKNAYGIQLAKDLSNSQILPSLTIYYARTIPLKEKKL